NACSSRRFAHGERNGIPLKPGLALKSSTDAYGQRITSWPLTFIEYAMFPTEGTVDTTVWLFMSSSCTTSPVCRAAYCGADAGEVAAMTMIAPEHLQHGTIPEARTSTRCFRRPASRTAGR